MIDLGSEKLFRGLYTKQRNLKCHHHRTVDLFHQTLKLILRQKQSVEINNSLDTNINNGILSKIRTATDFT